MAEVREVTKESLTGYRDMMAGAILKGHPDEQTRRGWAANQVYIALGNFLTSAAVLGLDACPMEGIEPAKYNEILGLDKKSLSTVVVATAGYRAATDKYSELKKVRFPKEQVLLRV
jgi:nitroreductase